MLVVLKIKVAFCLMVSVLCGWRKEEMYPYNPETILHVRILLQIQQEQTTSDSDTGCVQNPMFT
jgi:hypothetical protein